MKANKLFYTGVISFCILAACQNSNSPDSRKIAGSKAAHPDTNQRADDKLKQPGDETYESNVDGDGATFMKEAALGGVMEVELGKVAQKKANSSKVRAFGAKMVRDHTKANNELKAIAEKLKIILPGELPADKKEQLNTMTKLEGTNFDQQYMEMMVKDHVKDLQLFRSAGSLNKDVTDFIQKTIPMLEMHHNEAVQIKSGLD